jgi:hypothetical protein
MGVGVWGRGGVSTTRKAVTITTWGGGGAARAGHTGTSLGVMLWVMGCVGKGGGVAVNHNEGCHTDCDSHALAQHMDRSHARTR